MKGRNSLTFTLRHIYTHIPKKYLHILRTLCLYQMPNAYTVICIIYKLFFFFSCRINTFSGNEIT